MESVIAKLKHNGKARTSETYKFALNSFKKFRQGEDIMLDCITSETMEAYEAWHHKQGVAPNTISFYTRILRAVEDDIIENRNPFRKVYTGVDKTIKRALALPVIKKIKTINVAYTTTRLRPRYVSNELLSKRNEFHRYGLSEKDRPQKRLCHLSPSKDWPATHHRVDKGDANDTQ